MRAEILASWQRSRLFGIDQERPALPVESDLESDSRPVRAALPVRLRRGASLIREVSGRSNSSPRIRRAGVTEEGGRGLFPVARRARNRGVRHMRTGKAVWAEQVPHSGRGGPGPEEADEQALQAVFDDFG